MAIRLVCIFTLCTSLYGYGQTMSSGSLKEGIKGKADTTLRDTKQAVRRSISGAKNDLLPDTSNTMGSNAKTKIKAIKGDSAGFAYENGKWVVPDKPLLHASDLIPHDSASLSAADLKAASPDESTIKSLPDIKEAEELFNKNDSFLGKGAGVKSDSLKQLGKMIEDYAKDPMEGIESHQKVYSRKSLKRLYDSLGVSKMDTLLALMPKQQEVTKEDLLEAIDHSFPSPSVGDEIGNSLNNLPGQDLHNGIPDMPQPDLSKFKLSSESLQELPPIRGYQFPTDSLNILDSLRQVNLMRSKLQLKEEEVSRNIKKAMITPKPRSLDKIYWDGLISFLKTDDFTLLQASPSLGYEIYQNLSIGAGPTISVKEAKKKYSVFFGYRTFAKYEVLSQRAYLQAEYLVDPVAIDQEYFEQNEYSALAGGGYLLPVSKAMAINMCLLYRVNNNRYSGGTLSPWVFRLGISSVKSKKTK